jgi:hypothetical protein
MHHKTATLYKRPFHAALGLEPAAAWAIILVFVLFTSMCIFAHLGSVLRFAYPSGALIVAFLLHQKYPVLYLGFSLWLWFLTPFISRVSDFYAGQFDETRLVLLAPYLAVLVILPPLLQQLPKLYKGDLLPYGLVLIGIAYSFCIGAISGSLFSVAKTGLDWLIPVLFSFYLASHWSNYPEYQQNIQRVFFWGVLVTGVYGIIQYTSMPSWDTFWLSAVIEKGASSFGNVDKQEVRLFSTMNSPGPFAVWMMAGLLMMLSGQGTRGILQIPASIAGYLSFMLTLVRSAWGGWMFGLVALMTSLSPKFQLRLVLIVFVLGLAVVPLTTMEPFAQTINDRLETLSNLDGDASARDRRTTYQVLFSQALSSLIGDGTGIRPTYDSAILDLLFTFGWLGMVFYGGGMVLLLFQVFRGSKGRSDAFISTIRAIVLAMCLQLVFGNVLARESGIIFWGFVGLGVAAQKYHDHQM